MSDLAITWPVEDNEHGDQMLWVGSWLIGRDGDALLAALPVGCCVWIHENLPAYVFVIEVLPLPVLGNVLPPCWPVLRW